MFLEYSRKFHSPGESIGEEFIPSQSELFRFIPISVSEPMRIIPNQSEKLFVSRLMKKGKKSIQSNLIRDNNPNESETKFSFRIQTEFSIRINPNESKVGMIRIDSYLKFSLDQSELGLIRIDVSELIRLGRIDF